jgi:hypothetical protein
LFKAGDHMHSPEEKQFLEKHMDDIVRKVEASLDSKPKEKKIKIPFFW